MTLLLQVPTFSSQTGDAAKVSDVLGNKGQAVNQGCGSHQDIDIADELTLSSRTGAMIS